VGARRDSTQAEATLDELVGEPRSCAVHKLIVDAVRFWRGTRQRPVSIMAVEDSIIELSKRFWIARCVLDQWQSSYLSERLNQRGLIETFTVAVDPARLDRMATQLQRVFAARQIRIPRHPELVEQLETIQGVEQRRRDLVRFTSGSGQDAGRHDDIIVALALSMESQNDQIGRSQIPDSFRSCWRSATVAYDPCRCYAFGGSDPGVGGDASCRARIANVYIKEQFAKFLAQGGDPSIRLRGFRKLHVLNSDFVSMVLANRWANDVGL
jgi:hypothetical protein